GGDVRVRRRRHPDGADPGRLRQPEEALRHPAGRRGSDGRVAAHQAEAHQRGPRQPDDGAGIDAGVQGRLRGAQEDGAGRDPADRHPGGPPRARGAVPAGAAGDGFGRPQEDGRGRGAAERPAAELRVPAVTIRFAPRLLFRARAGPRETTRGPARARNSERGRGGGSIMLTCPMCKKKLRGLEKECVNCKTDVSLLVDYVENLQEGLVRAEALTKAGELGEAVWAYLEVLEVDPDNTTAKRQVGQVVTAV